MKRFGSALFGLAALAAPTAVSAQPFSHLVFFDLKDDSSEARAALIEGMEKYLAPHEGILVFTTGERDESKQREVNDTEFDVSLAIIFESEEAQDAYQVTDAHKQFIAELSDNWDRVRVFDSTVPAGSLDVAGD